jgi:hypothetical protein
LRFVDDRIQRQFAAKLARVAAALGHEIGDDAMKHRAGVETAVHIRQKVCGVRRCLLVVELDREVALVGTYGDVGRSGSACKR